METKDIVGRKLGRSNKMLVVEAYKRGVQFEILPKKRFRMFHGGKSYTVRRGRVAEVHNSRLAIRVTEMKEVTSRLLRSKGYSAPENTVFNKTDLERAWKWAEPILPVVIKPYNDGRGRLVFVNIDNYDEFKQCFDLVAEKHDEVLIEEFIEGDEYRFTFANKEIAAIANRVPANVVGDGQNNIKRLIELKNEERESKGKPIHKKLELDKESERVLLKQGYSFNDVPKAKEVVYLRNNSNVSTGGDAIDVTNEINSDIKEYVRKAMLSIPGLRVCGTDVLITNGKSHILEINTHPMLSIHHFPWEGESHDVVAKVIDGMFPAIKNNR